MLQLACGMPLAVRLLGLSSKEWAVALIMARRCFVLKLNACQASRALTRLPPTASPTRPSCKGLTSAEGAAQVGAHPACDWHVHWGWGIRANCGDRLPGPELQHPQPGIRCRPCTAAGSLGACLSCSYASSTMHSQGGLEWGTGVEAGSSSTWYLRACASARHHCSTVHASRPVQGDVCSPGRVVCWLIAPAQHLAVHLSN